MFVIESLPIAILFCVVTMLGWGSWGNTQKLVQKDRWPFSLFYWDYVIGVLVLSVVLAVTAGSFGPFGMGVPDNLFQAEASVAARALSSGAIFNLSNVMLVIAIDAAGMSVAFPIGVGLALVIGTLGSYRASPKGDVTLLFGGVSLVLLAMVFSASAYRTLPGSCRRRNSRGILFAVTAGCLMGFFYPQLAATITPRFNSLPCQAGLLTPYSAMLLFGAGLFASNLVINTIVMKAAGVSYGQYLNGRGRLHFVGILGGMTWMLALATSVLASGVAGPAISYALGQGATLVAAIWGVFIWREFQDAPKSATRYVVLMFASYAGGLLLIGMASAR